MCEYGESRYKLLYTLLIYCYRCRKGVFCHLPIATLHCTGLEHPHVVEVITVLCNPAFTSQRSTLRHAPAEQTKLGCNIGICMGSLNVCTLQRASNNPLQWLNLNFLSRTNILCCMPFISSVERTKAVKLNFDPNFKKKSFCCEPELFSVR